MDTMEAALNEIARLREEIVRLREVIKAYQDKYGSLTR